MVMTGIEKYTEDQLVTWTKPVSVTEEQRSDNVISMVYSAINDYNWSFYSISKPSVFLKGSYKANTNVKLDSDVDVYVLFNYSYRITSDQEIIYNKFIYLLFLF